MWRLLILPAANPSPDQASPCLGKVWPQHFWNAQRRVWPYGSNGEFDIFIFPVWKYDFVWAICQEALRALHIKLGIRGLQKRCSSSFHFPWKTTLLLYKSICLPRGLSSNKPCCHIGGTRSGASLIRTLTFRNPCVLVLLGSVSGKRFGSHCLVKCTRQILWSSVQTCTTRVCKGSPAGQSEGLHCSTRAALSHASSGLYSCGSLPRHMTKLSLGGHGAKWG